jgi:hypothetical protein
MYCELRWGQITFGLKFQVEDPLLGPICATGIVACRRSILLDQAYSPAERRRPVPRRNPLVDILVVPHLNKSVMHLICSPSAT